MDVVKKEETKKESVNLEKLIDEKDIVTIEISQNDIASLNGIHDYLHSRPMSEIEGGVFYIRALLKRIKSA